MGITRQAATQVICRLINGCQVGRRGVKLVSLYLREDQIEALEQTAHKNKFVRQSIDLFLAWRRADVRCRKLQTMYRDGDIGIDILKEHIESCDACKVTLGKLMSQLSG